ncbi:MAG TPA: MarR family transcriptional regulator [Micromonosporaceae bacterium]|jgi:MarR family transcriptional regulator for hemolysin
MDEILGLFPRASKLLRSAADEAMARHGVRIGQNLVIEALSQTDGMTPGDLAARLGVAVPTMVKSTSRMEAAGLLTRRRDEADRRLVRIYLTDQARSVAAAIQQARTEVWQRATATLTPAEHASLTSALKKIIQQLS